MKTVKLDQFVCITAPKGKIAKENLRRLVDAAGGATVKPATGFWVNYSGDTIAEEVVHVTANFQRAYGPDVMTAAHDIIAQLLRDGEQAVLWQDNFGVYVTTP